MRTREIDSKEYLRRECHPIGAIQTGGQMPIKSESDIGNLSWATNELVGSTWLTVKRSWRNRQTRLLDVPGPREDRWGIHFFVIRFLRALAEEGLLRFDSDTTAWI
jgi:hypothetical protein